MAETSEFIDYHPFTPLVPELFCPSYIENDFQTVCRSTLSTDQDPSSTCSIKNELFYSYIESSSKYKSPTSDIFFEVLGPKIFEDNQWYSNNFLESTLEKLTISAPYSVALVSLGLGYYAHGSKGFVYLAAGVSASITSMLTSLYFESPFINNVGILIIKYSSMKFFAASIEDNLLNRESKWIAPISTIAASGITTAWILLENHFFKAIDNKFTNDLISYTELVPAVFTKRVIQDFIVSTLTLGLKAFPVFDISSKLSKAAIDFFGLFIGGAVKDSIYNYREVKNYTIPEIISRQLVSTTSKMLPGVAIFNKYEMSDDEKSVIYFTTEWVSNALSSNIGKHVFEKHLQNYICSSNREYFSQSAALPNNVGNNVVENYQSYDTNPKEPLPNISKKDSASFIRITTSFMEQEENDSDEVNTPSNRI